MRSRALLAALGAALITANAHAQTTADGVAALARGDEALAAQILRPIAEDWRRDDRAAEFFLGTMYETGRGVPLDPLRACALYQMTTAFSDQGIFSEPAYRLIRKLLQVHGNAWYEECGVLATIGLGHRFETTSFALSSGESVEWTLAGATVTYQQRSRRFPIRVASRGAIFLPLRRTELRVPGGPAPRHLVQLLFWQPSSSGTTWSLQWFLYEISQGSLAQAGFETELKRSEGRQPPELSALELDALVGLRVNDQGVAVATLQTQAGPRIVELPKR